jgi:pantoate--beta-alanine ligase
MNIFSNILETKKVLGKHQTKVDSIGFVPTMGALHQGHISLVNKAVNENNVVVVSIFVNPTQFNDKSDLKNYPRTPEKDIKLLEEAGVHYIFMPTEHEIYPEPDTRVFDFGLLDKVMEGAHRPGHFNGVAQVVSKLFEIIEPNRAYFGQKDFQQLAIIRHLVKQLNLEIEIIACPIMRESDGLAMSSRNLLLDSEKRKSAPLIFKTLNEASNKAHELSVQDLIHWVIATINKDPNLVVEYFSLVDSQTLQPISDWEEAISIVGCIAVKVGQIRLIDNTFFK